MSDSNENDRGNDLDLSARSVVDETLRRTSVLERNEMISDILSEGDFLEADGRVGVGTGTTSHDAHTRSSSTVADTKSDLAILTTNTAAKWSRSCGYQPTGCSDTKRLKDADAINVPTGPAQTEPVERRQQHRLVPQPGAVSVSGHSLDGNESIEEEAVGSPFLEVHATVVDEEYDEDAIRVRVEEQIRTRFLSEAVMASVVKYDNGEQADSAGVPTKDTAPRSSSRSHTVWLVGGLISLAVLAIGLGVGLSQNRDDDSDSNDGSTSDHDDLVTGLSTLNLVKQRGYLRCGISDFEFAEAVDETDESNSNTKPFKGPHMKGFNVEQCRAMALLALGNPNLFELMELNQSTRFANLHKGKIDMLADGSTHTMERDVWVSTQESLDDDETISAAYSFSVPYFYSGLTFAGKPTYVDCVDTFDVFNGDCRNVRICVSGGSTHVAITYDLLKGSFLVLSDETSELVEQYRRGDCNVIAGESVFLGKLPPDITEDMKFSNQIVSKEPLCIVTRNNDPEWSDLARLVVNTWILAEANNITQATAPLILDLFSKKKEDGSNQLLQSQMLSLVQEFGNHGELYEKYIQDLIPRDNGLNRPYNRSRTNGLLYSTPFGDLKGIGRDPIANGTLEKILVRGYLRCGVQPFRGAAFASESNGDMQQNNGTSMVWSGFDVDFCRAVAAAIFAGNGDKLTFVAFNEEADGYVLLADDSVDVVAGARVSLQADILAPELDHGVQFSLPYFYDNDSRESYALMTRQSDLRFPDFVYWIVAATIYAEEQGITSESSLQMPIQSFFGETFKQCFRDSISSVGSYGEIYNRTLQDFIPRTGANRLNDGQPGAQMFPISPV